MAIIAAGCAAALCASLFGAPLGDGINTPDIPPSTYFYAYMDLNAAGEESQPKIRQARKAIIAQHGWVTEGVQGFVTDQNGNVIEELPQFYDIFPADWEIPVFPSD